jgi:hypothetical protein
MYHADWTGAPGAEFVAKPNSRDHRQLQLPERAFVGSISSTGEMALLITSDANYLSRTLAVAPEGGAPRELANSIKLADWGPDGLAVARIIPNGYRIEYPLGTKLFEIRDYTVLAIRVSRDGGLIAVSGMGFEGASFHGEIGIIDRKGQYRVLYKSPAGSAINSDAIPCWSPDGKEIWFSTLEFRHPGGLYAVSLQGKLRPLVELPESVQLADVDRSGRMLLSFQERRSDILISDSTGEHEMPWYGLSEGPRLTDDGKYLIFGEVAIQQFRRSTYRRALDGTAAVKLSEGFPLAVSPSGKSVVVWRADADPAYVIVPTGVGEEKAIRASGWDLGPGAPMGWMPDEKALVTRARKPGMKGFDLIVYSTESGSVRSFSHDQAIDSTGRPIPALPDGSAVFAPVSNAWMRFPLSGGPATKVEGMQPGEQILRCAADGKHVYVAAASTKKLDLSLLDLQTGARSAVKQVNAELRPIFFEADITPDGRLLAIQERRFKSKLFILTGVK